MKKFNVLLVTYTLEIGGAETAVTSIARYLNPDKFRPVVCSIRHGGDIVEHLRQINIPVYILSKKTMTTKKPGKLNKLLLLSKFVTG